MIELAVGVLLMMTYLFVFTVGYRMGIQKAVGMLSEILQDIENRLKKNDDTD